ncbi:MAG TPA: hypothetical protein VN808_08395 [Stellaceae bacterium]|nr:hypothetical protein [Stellaceae bacterium]
MTNKWAKIYFTALLFWLWASASQAETALVTPEEALLPPSPVLTQRGPPDGPKVELTGPDSGVASGTPFSLSAVFKPRPETSIDPNSVHIILLRGDGVDVTERVRTAGRIDQTGIDLKGLQAPPGEYRIRVLVDDTSSRPGFADITLKIDAPH